MAAGSDGKAGDGELRWAVLWHEPGPALEVVGHYDWLFDVDGAGPVAAFRCPCRPSEMLAVGAVELVRLADHRRAYLELAAGERSVLSGGRGWVERAEGGTLVWRERGPARLRCAMECGSWRLELVLERASGERWRACWAG